MTVIEALQIIQLLAPLIQQGISNGTMEISDADLAADSEKLGLDLDVAQKLIDAKKAAGL